MKDKNDMHKNVFDGRKEFIRCIRKNHEMDFYELYRSVILDTCNEDTSHLYSKQVNGCQGMVFQV